DPLALPGLQDISFNVNVGTGAADGNLVDNNVQAGVVIEALDHGTGSFAIRGNQITNNRDDKNAATVYAGDGIVARLDSDLLAAEAVGFLSASIIDDNIIGVDNQGNEGNGLSFSMAERTRIQDLELTNNQFLNNGIDGFHFSRQEDADLNTVVIEKNRATNNTGDGFDLFAKNTTKDRMDFRINENVVDNNGQYGVRIDVQADARIGVVFNENSVTGNGHTPAGQGFHPNDGVAGSTGAGGGVGIRAFQQIDIEFSAENTHIDSNFGDGFSVDAFYFFDTLVMDATFINSTMNSNTLTGFRSHGSAFGLYDFNTVEFNDNGEDGMRIVSIEDKTDLYQRRVGGMDIDLRVMNSDFFNNVKDGAHIGQGVSAVFGDGSIENSNNFSLNGRDGFKVTQHNSPYLDDIGRHRIIQMNRNFYQANGSDGIDIGHDTRQEAGNTEHGDEIASDVYITVNQAVITNNLGDGVEYLGDDLFRIGRIAGGGQDVPAAFNSQLAITNSRIVNNAGRGVDILNRHQEDTFVSMINNDILSNGMEGVYVMNTASHDQVQVNSADPLAFIINSAVPNPNIELRFQDNLVESNGNPNQTSLIPANFEHGNNDKTGQPIEDWRARNVSIPGTLGGLVIRVGTADTPGRLLAANPALELGLSGIDAEVVNNSFDGNYGADVYFDSFVSQMPPQSQGLFQAGESGSFRWSQGFRDPLARLDLVFRGNVGNSLDVTNGFAFLDNDEDYFKSRINVPSNGPTDHTHNPLNDVGAWVGLVGGDERRRNLTRTIGYITDQVGDVPSFQVMTNVGINWSYDGTGTPTWRVESDFDFNSFTQTTTQNGYSDFFDVITMDGLFDYQWDTGVNTP
ncbi:MAG: right-handed parallel beta-helix repeat-containing protein, partial [Planctomycetaceae bacterium]|nr:right-handed parallel beta-helix repeat-containing protein [Planctomycetaceae bacterium]